MGRQFRSVGAWILVVRPARERPIAWFRSPPFQPEAQRCAFTAEESIKTSADGPTEVASAKTGSTTHPLAAQRWKRLYNVLRGP